MVAIVVSLASTLLSSASPSSSSSSLFTKLRSCPKLRLSFSITPLSPRRANLRMAHTIAKATLGLTLPNAIEPPKVFSFFSFFFFSFFALFFSRVLGFVICFFFFFLGNRLWSIFGFGFLWVVRIWGFDLISVCVGIWEMVNEWFLVNGIWMF